MKKVAVFGNAGAGKSTLARRLSRIAGLPLHTIDILQYRDGRYRPDEKDGGKLAPETYAALHRETIARERWIIDGYDNTALAWERFAAADTLIFVDPPLAALYWGVTRRLIGGMLRTPKGWPARSPVWASSMASYRTIPLCHRALTPKYRALFAEAAATKRVHHLRSAGERAEFLEAVAREYATRRQDPEARP